MKKRLYPILLILLLCSCSQQDREITIIEQEAAIDKFISSKFADKEVVRQNGANRIIIENGISSQTLNYGDSLSFYYSGFIFSSSGGSLFSTNVEEVAKQASLTLTNQNFSPENLLFKEYVFTKGLTNGLLGMKEKEHSVIIFSAKYGFNNTRVYNVPKLSPLMYEVWVEKIKKN